jgi:hypothetical protein
MRPENQNQRADLRSIATIYYSGSVADKSRISDTQYRTPHTGRAHSALAISLVLIH